MNKAIIKGFALWARKKLTEDMLKKAYELGIEKNLDKIIEEASFIWFNRLTTLRFMEVNGYIPRALSIDKNISEEFYRTRLIAQCNYLNKMLPEIFEEVEDYIELLLPNNLLQEGSIIRKLVEGISDDEFKNEVEIIGWLYQYFISEKKDKVFRNLKNNEKIAKENIPAVTQLFTPQWVVKYMVENSVGSLWLEGHATDESLKNKWKYHLEQAIQAEEVSLELSKIRGKLSKIKPEDIKVLDPAVGTGHILVYVFEVLYDIYLSAGYSRQEIPRLILEKNLYGLDIDSRATKMAYFEVIMKAKSKNNFLFAEKLELNIISIEESESFSKEVIDFLLNGNTNLKREEVEYLLNVYSNAKEYGSILQVEKIDFTAFFRRIEEIRSFQVDGLELEYKKLILDKLPKLLKQAKIMSDSYDVVITNPPYMGNRGMNSKLSNYIKNYYPDSKTDFFAVFMERCRAYTKPNGFYSMITQPSWLFLSTFSKLREKIIAKDNIVSLLHMGRGIFGIDFGSTAFVIRNSYIKNYYGNYFRLHERVFQYIASDDIKEIFLKAKENTEFKFNFSINNNTNEEDITKSLKELKIYYCTCQDNYFHIPGYPIAYWASQKLNEIFDKDTPLYKVAKPKQGIATGENNRFLRHWSEVNFNNIGFNFKNSNEAGKSNFKWFPYNKGGSFRKWYGNNEYVVNWRNDGHEIKNLKNKNGTLKSRPQNLQYHFREGITWSFVSSKSFGARYFSNGFLFDVGGSCVFPQTNDIYYLTALLCSKVTMEFLKIQNPTLNFQVGNVANLPVIITDDLMLKNRIEVLSRECIEISKNDWDSFETSWDFKKHPLLKFKGNSGKIKEAYENWSSFKQQQFLKLKENEEELNKIFIEIYGLQEELSAFIDEKEITVNHVDSERDIKSFISFAVGCIFGRYSLDETLPKNDFDNIIPILDEDYFEDDITTRFIDFLKITFGESNICENMEYIAGVLGRKASEMPKQAIRRYFLKEFYNQHIKTYKKKPIYWMFTSGECCSFKALIYMHGYNKFTIAKVSSDLHRLQKKYAAQIKKMLQELSTNMTDRDKITLRKKNKQLLKQQIECEQYSQVITAFQKLCIEINLDEGVSINHSKFQGIEVPTQDGKSVLKVNLLVEI